MAEKVQAPTPSAGIPIMLDKERHLRYTWSTRKKIIADAGGEEKFQKLSGENLPRVLWFGLTHEDPNLTVEQVEDSLDLARLEEYADAMLKAMGYTGKLVQAAETPAGNPPTAAAVRASER